MNHTPLQYALVTAARNEAAVIELTIGSMLAQTVKPLRWVIVSDGSTDGTDAIVQRHAAAHSWIELVQMPPRTERHFAGKVHAFNAGLARLKALAPDYEVIGSLDADISFDDQYFAFLLGKLSLDPSLGLVGTPFKDTTMYDYRFVSLEHVSGACQLFRRACFEAIGGYQPLRTGGVDHVAVLSARMAGWRTRTFTEKICLHHRQIGTAERSVLHARFRTGALDHALGGHPLWEVCRGAYQMTRPPYVLGGVALSAGYLWAALRGAPRSITPDLMRFRRREQMQRLRTFITGRTLRLRSAVQP